MKPVDVTIIGAGPYGLSLATFLSNLGIDYRIFGDPMEGWSNHMPKGMFLKSEGFASTLYDPSGASTLESYCSEHGIPYAHMGKPVRLEDFCAYGRQFQRRLVPNLENKQVTSLKPDGSRFRLELDNGESVIARTVVMAVGLRYFPYLPPQLSSLSEEFVSHTSRHTNLEQFKGREVAVIGAGASAADFAALANEAGASVQLFARRRLEFHTKSKVPRPLLDQLRAPSTPLGPGWRNLFCTHGPLVFYGFPRAFQQEILSRHLGPAPGWFVREKIEGIIPVHEEVRLDEIVTERSRVRLRFKDGHGNYKNMTTDHIVAGTGYRVKLESVPILSQELKRRIRSTKGSPVLSASFESSVPGLYFVGIAAAASFGPLLRFACGARFTAGRLSHRLKAALGATSRGQVLLPQDGARLPSN